MKEIKLFRKVYITKCVRTIVTIKIGLMKMSYVMRLKKDEIIMVLHKRIQEQIKEYILQYLFDTCNNMGDFLVDNPPQPYQYYSLGIVSDGSLTNPKLRFYLINENIDQEYGRKSFNYIQNIDQLIKPAVHTYTDVDFLNQKFNKNIVDFDEQELNKISDGILSKYIQDLEK